ncbi:CocE/NonD family hydrolase [Nocardioides fonticola]|uniref:CocE/NonD family hydrolase n=1 Tax=Nocardioides fonticola TaxID=450363 RepID=A0ABP7XI62_9ACTN
MSTVEHRSREVAIRLRDGVVLRGTLHLPGAADAVRVPTLLQRTPYDRADPHETQTMTCLPVARALAAGFAVLLLDCRGRHGSAGAFEPFAAEADDARDVLAWVRAADFSDGRVVGYGPSYVGAVQFVGGEGGYDAILPALTSAAPRRDWVRQGGAVNLGFLLTWIIEALAPHDLERRGIAADDPRRLLLDSLLADPRAALHRLPVLDGGLEAIAPWLADWLATPDDEQGDGQDDGQDDAGVPALHVAGLHDVFLEGSLATYAAMRAGAAGDRQHLVLGPWSHGERGEWQGVLRHAGGAASAIDLAGRQLAFAEAVLAGRRPAMPRVLHYLTGAGRWCVAEEWPPPSAPHVLHLAPGELRATPGPAAEVVVRADPADPVPTCGGPTFLPGMAVCRHAGPHDQRPIEARDDVAVFRSEPLEEPLTVVGPVVAELSCSSDAIDLDWAVRLVDVAPDGVPHGVTDGIRRVRQEPGIMRVEIAIGHVSHVFGAGHRIGLQIAGSNHPRFDRATHTGADPWRTPPSRMRPAVQILHLGGEHVARIALPVPVPPVPPVLPEEHP